MTSRQCNCYRTFVVAFATGPGVSTSAPSTTDQGVYRPCADAAALSGSRGQPDPALLAAYDQRIRDFQAEQKMRVTDWTEQSALRVRDEAALTGREVLRDFLRDRGFSLR